MNDVAPNPVVPDSVASNPGVARRGDATSDIPATMRAAHLLRLGGPEEIRVGQLPVPHPGPTDVLVQVRASAVDHVDALIRSGAYPTPTPSPFVIGRDLVGTVVAAGAGAEDRIGQQVWSASLGHHGRQGAAAEYAVVPVDRLYSLPAGVDPLQTVALAHGATTAHLGLSREAELQAGETVLIGGAAGAVGSAAVQLAHAAGARVIATAAPADHDWIRSHGAEAVLDYHADDLATDLQRVAGDGVDIWWETSGHHDLDLATSLLRPGGRILLMAGIAATTPLPVGALYTRDARVLGFAHSNASAADLSAAAERINALLAAGTLRGRIDRVLPLEQAADAHRLLETGGLHGRILLSLD